MDLVSGVLRMRGSPGHPARRVLKAVKAAVPFPVVEAVLGRLLWLGNAGLSGSWPHVDASRADGTAGVNVYGFLNRPLGLGEAARSSLAALGSAGVPAEGIALEEEDLWRPRPTVAAARPPHCVNLCHVNAPEMGFLVRAFGAGAFKGRVNIGYWFWECAQLPRSWDIAFRYLDEVWVASSFVQAAVAQRSPVAVTRIPPVVEVAVKDADWRAAFGIPHGRPAILCMYDARSTAERKNPIGAIIAARKAFTGTVGPKPVVVVKAWRAGDSHGTSEMQSALGGLDSVVIDRTLGREETSGLISACDTFVSLHRGEGFGLVIAEAMALGKPVVATGYSGNMDFMDEDNSYPVDFRVVANARRADPYQKGYLWAEPDVDHAATLIREIFAHADRARVRGRLAAETIAKRFSARTVGAMMRARLEEMGLALGGERR